MLTGKSIIRYHEHDSLLENQVDQVLTGEEKQAAWDEFEKLSNPTKSDIGKAIEAYQPTYQGKPLPYFTHEGVVVYWKVFYDPKNTRWYYFNPITQKTQWSHPDDTPAPAPAMAMASLAGGSLVQQSQAAMSLMQSIDLAQANTAAVQAATQQAMTHQQAMYLQQVRCRTFGPVSLSFK